MALTNEQINGLLDGGLRAEAERLRAQKARLASLRARAPQYTDIPDKAETVIVSNRSDAASLPAISEKDLREFLYALGTVQAALDAIPLTLLEKFCVRAFEVEGEKG